MNEDANRTKLGARLRDAREYCGYSQDEVARALRVPRTAISLLESGERGLDALELTKLAKLYQCSVDDLMGQTKKVAEPESIKMLARAANDLSEEDRDEVLRFAQFLKSRKQKE